MKVNKNYKNIKRDSKIWSPVSGYVNEIDIQSKASREVIDLFLEKLSQCEKKGFYKVGMKDKNITYFYNIKAHRHTIEKYGFMMAISRLDAFLATS